MHLIIGGRDEYFFSFPRCVDEMDILDVGWCSSLLRLKDSELPVEEIGLSRSRGTLLRVVGVLWGWLGKQGFQQQTLVLLRVVAEPSFSAQVRSRWEVSFGGKAEVFIVSDDNPAVFVTSMRDTTLIFGGMSRFSGLVVA